MAAPLVPIRNIAQRLVDLHDAQTVFDFCGGMFFQLLLSDALRSHLNGIATAGGPGQPIVFGATTNKMDKMPGYRKVFESPQAEQSELPSQELCPNAHVLKPVFDA